MATKKKGKARRAVPVRSSRAKPAIMVDRAGFIAWTNGMFERRGNSLVVGDAVENAEAERLLMRGEAVGLMINNKLKSTLLKDNKGRIVEKTVE
jgi:hypothetical protein